MKNKIYLFTILGAISGFISFFSFSVSLKGETSSSFLGYCPGFIFGLIISVLLYFRFRRSIFFHVIFIAISTCAYYVAIQIFSHFQFENDSSKALFMAGFVGSSTLVAGLRSAYSIPFKYMLGIVVLGSIVSLPIEQLGMFYFSFWQAAVATALGIGIIQSNNLQNQTTHQLL